MPQLYRLSIEPDAAPVKVDSSFYGAWRKAREQAGEHYDFRENDAGFNESMRVLKSTLAASTPVDTRLSVTTSRRFVEHTADEDVVGWSLSVALAIDGSIGVGRVTSYCDRTVRLQRWLSLPKPGLSIAVVSHKGVPQEGCYDTEDIVVLRRKPPQAKRQSAEGIGPAVATASAWRPTSAGQSPQRAC